MIIVNSKAGQRSNRLVTLAHAMATAIDQRESLLITTFGLYADDYRRIWLGPGHVVLRPSLFWEFVRLFIAIAKRFGFLRILSGRVISDWTFRNPTAVERYQDVIRAYFEPARRFPALPQTAGMVVVGVHKRRGDYAQFMDGRYFYDDEVYAANVESVRHDLERRHLKVHVIEFPKDDPVRDQWVMSQCDYLMGPPSTFTMWASFMGKVPLGIITDRTKVLTLDDFKYQGLIA